MERGKKTSKESNYNHIWRCIPWLFVLDDAFAVVVVVVAEQKKKKVVIK